jgi:hypothetical protein
MQRRSVEGPMPILPWRISPDRYSTAISISPAFSARRQSASRRVFAERAEAMATCREVTTIVANRVMTVFQRDFTRKPAAQTALQCSPWPGWRL